MNRIKYMFVVILLTFFMLVGCTFNEDKITIATSIYPVYDITKAIVKDKIPVYMTVPAGIDTHSYDPSVDNIVRVKKATLFIYVSDELESWATDLKTTDSEHFVLNLTSNTTIELIEHEEEDEANEHEHEHDHDHRHHHEYDPHIWTSPKNVIIMAEKIYESVIKIDPENTEFYLNNKNNYINELNKIINDYNTFSESANNTTFYFGSPFSLGYLFRDFNLKYYAIFDTCETEIEPSIDKIIALKKTIIENNIKYLYIKELSSTKISESIVNGTNCELALIHTGHNLSSTDFKKGLTLLEIFKTNLDTLKKGVE